MKFTSSNNQCCVSEWQRETTVKKRWYVILLMCKVKETPRSQLVLWCDMKNWAFCPWDYTSSMPWKVEERRMNAEKYHRIWLLSQSSHFLEYLTQTARELWLHFKVYFGRIKCIILFSFALCFIQNTRSVWGHGCSSSSDLALNRIASAMFWKSFYFLYVTCKDLCRRGTQTKFLWYCFGSALHSYCSAPRLAWFSQGNEPHTRMRGPAMKR